MFSTATAEDQDAHGRMLGWETKTAGMRSEFQTQDLFFKTTADRLHVKTRPMILRGVLCKLHTD